MPVGETDIVRRRGLGTTGTGIGASGIDGTLGDLTGSSETPTLEFFI